MTTTNHDPRTVLTVPWLVAEPDQVPIVPAVPVAAEPEPLPAPAPDDLTPERRTFSALSRAFITGAYLTFAGLVGLALLAIGFLDAIGFLVFTVVILAGCLVLLGALPFDDPAGQCTPSRNTLTGRAQ